MNRMVWLAVVVLLLIGALALHLLTATQTKADDCELCQKEGYQPCSAKPGGLQGEEVSD